MSEMRQQPSVYNNNQQQYRNSSTNESTLVEKEDRSVDMINGAESSSNGTVRRKLERFRSKLIELFFSSSSSSSSSSSVSSTTSSSITPPLTPHSHTTTATSNTMSTYYFGYTTTSTSSSRLIMNSNNYDATSTASSLTSDDSNSSSASSASAASLPLDSASANLMMPESAASDANNPFLDASLTSRLIHLNVPDLDLLKSQFEPFLCTIDDEDNFFDAAFMSAYIAYTLVTRLREHTTLELRQQQQQQDSNLAHEIAREIFAQSESEPCGLKGCRINVILESPNGDNDSDDSMYSNQSSNRILLDRFRFDSTCLLTTFELNLVLKQVTTPTNSRGSIDVNNNTSSSSRLFSSPNNTNNSTNRKNSTKSVKFLTGPQRSTPVNHVTTNNNIIYLDDTQFHLYKCSLY